MAIKFYARVKDTVASAPGLGNVTLSGVAPAGFRTFSSILLTGDLFYYCMEEQTPGSWEVGKGLWLGSHQFQRLEVTGSSNANVMVNFASAAMDCFMTVPGDFLNEVWVNGRVFAARMGCDMP